MFTPTLLIGRNLRLEPLEERHMEDLWKVVSPELFQYMNLWWRAESPADFREGVSALRNNLGCIIYAMVLSDSGRAVGSSSYLDLRPEHRSLEVGAS